MGDTVKNSIVVGTVLQELAGNVRSESRKARTVAVVSTDSYFTYAKVLHGPGSRRAQATRLFTAHLVNPNRWQIVTAEASEVVPDPEAAPAAA